MGDVAEHPGDVWRDLIRNAGVTQAYVAGRMGVSQKHLSQILHNHRLASADHTVAFAHVMGADAHKLWLFQADCEIKRALKAYKSKRVRGLPAPPAEWARPDGEAVAQ